MKKNSFIILLIILIIVGGGIIYFYKSANAPTETGIGDENNADQNELTCDNTLITSPEAPGHVHEWCADKEYTEDFCNDQDDCHNHKINEEQNLAEEGGVGPHIHSLTANNYVDLTAEQTKNLLDRNPNIIVLDVSPNYAAGHLPGAINYYIGDGSLDAAIPTLDKNAVYLVYCHVDSASIGGAEKLIAAGAANVYRLQGNYVAWTGAGYPVEK